MSLRTKVIVCLVVVPVWICVLFILRWQRHFFLRRICPREILLLETAEERNRVCDRGLTAFLKDWRTWMIFLVYSVALGLATRALLGLAGAVIQWGPRSLAYARLTFFVTFIGEMFLIPLMCARFRKWMRVFLRAYLNDHGIPICEHCGYDLRGNIESRCPECGTKVLPRASF